MNNHDKKTAKVVQILEKAQEILKENDWTVGTTARTRSGDECHIISRDACKFCMLGALIKSASETMNLKWIYPEKGIPHLVGNTAIDILPNVVGFVATTIVDTTCNNQLNDFNELVDFDNSTPDAIIGIYNDYCANTKNDAINMLDLTIQKVKRKK